MQLLGMVLEHASGMNGQAYFKKYLFGPLGMDNTTLVKDRVGKNWVIYGGCQKIIRGDARIGLLLPENGKVSGNQVISKSWISESLKPSVLASYFSQLWRIDGNSEHFNVVAMDDPGVKMIWFPEIDLLLLPIQAWKNHLRENPGYNSVYWMGPHFINKIREVVID